jgi:predicted protein tyrosine phosphatase
MKYLTIGPKHLANEAKTKFNCDFVISIQDHEDQYNEIVPTPLGIVPENHKHFFFDDLTDEVPLRKSSRPEEPVRGHLPDMEDVQGIINFFATIPDWSRVYFHCFAGVSRSTAMSFACLCSEDHEGSEVGNLQLVERFALSNSIWPNDTIVRLADEYLGRQGKMIRALKDWKQAEKALSFDIDAQMAKTSKRINEIKDLDGKPAHLWDDLQKSLKIDKPE